MQVICATRISQRLLRASFDGAVCIYVVQFYQTPKPDEDKIFNESHRVLKCDVTKK